MSALAENGMYTIKNCPRHNNAARFYPSRSGRLMSISDFYGPDRPFCLHFRQRLIHSARLIGPTLELGYFMDDDSHEVGSHATGGLLRHLIRAYASNATAAPGAPAATSKIKDSSG